MPRVSSTTPRLGPRWPPRGAQVRTSSSRISAASASSWVSVRSRRSAGEVSCSSSPIDVPSSGGGVPASLDGMSRRVVVATPAGAPGSALPLTGTRVDDHAVEVADHLRLREAGAPRVLQLQEPSVLETYSQDRGLGVALVVVERAAAVLGGRAESEPLAARVDDDHHLAVEELRVGVRDAVGHQGDRHLVRVPDVPAVRWLRDVEVAGVHQRAAGPGGRGYLASGRVVVRPRDQTDGHEEGQDPGQPSGDAGTASTERGACPTQVGAGVDRARLVDGVLEQVVDLSHDRGPPVWISAPSSTRRWASALAFWDLTVPSAHPRACAVAATSYCRKWRSTTTARCRGGRACRAAITTDRVSGSPRSWSAASGVRSASTSRRRWALRRSSRKALVSARKP